MPQCCTQTSRAQSKRTRRIRWAVEWIAFALIALGFAVCGEESAGGAPVGEAAHRKTDGLTQKHFPPGKTELQILARAPASEDGAEGEGESIAVTVHTPQRPVRGDVLVLPGWRHDRGRWLRETSLDEVALSRGFRLICPEMDVSIYASRYFPETRRRWSPAPGLVWLREQLLPELQERGLFPPGGNNFLLGYSTGARGGALLALEDREPQLFRAAALLAGDYAQERMPGDRLMAGVYGPHADFAERWRTVDNPAARGRELRTPLFLAHGTRDTIVPPEQSRVFAEAVRAAGDATPPLELREPAAGHGYDFLETQTPAVFDWFEAHGRFAETEG